MLENMEPTLIALLSFGFVAIAARFIGKFFSQYGLPYITGYLLAGVLAGPFILELMQSGDVGRLRFIDELSLAVIAFIAGSELYLKELQNRMRPILMNIGGIVVIAFTLLSVIVFIATDFIAFADDLEVQARIAVALLGATILLALSPASTIAVIQEVRARGNFSRTVLSITVVMDVIIIVLFAISAAFAGVLLEGESIGISFLFILILDLILAVVLGVIAGKLLEGIISSDLGMFFKSGLVLALGLGIFVLAFEVTAWTKDMGVAIHLEPLLISMIAGFYMTNFTRYRDQFDEILHDVSPMIYVAFFTLTGVALKLDVLVATGFVAGILFLVRMFSIFAGSYVGGTLAKEPVQFRQLAWMGLITQAGIALGLAREVSVEFPSLGDDFATLIISVVVLNEIFGPLFLKYVLRRVGEARVPESGQAEPERHAILLGVEPQSLTLARQLKAHGWNVVLADTNQEHVERLRAEDVDEYHIEQIDEKTLRSLTPQKADAVVAMLDDDDDNLQVCTLACEELEVKRVIVRLKDVSRTQDFVSHGALVVNPAVAMVNLLDQYVRAPQSASLIMHDDPEHEVTQITVTNQDVDGMLVRDLRLPGDILILEITHRGRSVVPNGYTTIHVDDEVTMLGSVTSLEQVTLRLGY